MALATLSIDVLAKLASFEAGMDKAARIAAKAADDVQRRWDKLGAGLAAVGGTLGTVLGSAALAQIARDTINSLDALNDLKDATGASIENLSALEDVALRTGTSMETVGTAVLKLNRFLSDATPGSNQASMLKQLGLDAEALRREDPAEALRQVAVALSNFEDNGNKARFTQELLGKSIKDVSPLLNDLAEKTKLVGTVSADQAAEAEKFNKQIAEMEKNALDAKRALVNELLPAINALIDRVRGNGGLLDSMLGALELDSFARQRKEVERLNLKLVAQTRIVDDLREGVEKEPANRGFSEALERQRAKLQELQKQAAEASAALKSTADILNPPVKLNSLAGAGRGFVNPEVIRPSLPGDSSRPDRGTSGRAATAPQIDKVAKAYDALIAKITERTSAAEIELATGQKLNDSHRFALEVVTKLADREAKFTDEQKRSVATLLERSLAATEANEAQRQLLRGLQETARIEAQQLVQLSSEAERRAGITQQLREQAEAYGKTAGEVDALGIARLREALAIEQQTLTMEQNAKASSAQITERERIIRLLQDEINLRTGLAERARLDATDPLRGASRALADYQDEISRVGDSTYSLLRNGIDGFEQRTAEMLTRGKADWKAYFTQIALEAARVNLVRPGLSRLINLGMNLLTGGNPAASLVGATGFGDYNAVAAIAAGRAYGGPVGPREMRPVVERGLPELLDTPDGTWLLTGAKGGHVRALDKRAGGAAVQAPARMSVTVVNTGAPVQVTGQRQLSDSELMLMIDNSRQAAVDASAALVRSSVATPNGDLHRTLRSTFNLQPRR